MTPTRDASAVLDREFLVTRSLILNLAAALDRLDRAPVHHDGVHHAPPDRRIAQIRQALEALQEPGADRAETVQRLFSLDYDPEWMANLQVSKRF